jgi:hypothetical protein
MDSKLIENNYFGIEYVNYQQQGRKRMSKQLYLLAMLIILATLVGCSMSSPTAEVSTETPMEKVMPSLTVKPSSTFTKESIKTQTLTVTPSLTFTPIWTPNPTLSTEEALLKVRELLETNGGCEFPCWWGLTPGISMWDEAKKILEPIAFLSVKSRKQPYSDREQYEVYLPKDETPSLINSIATTFLIDKETNIVEEIMSSQDFSLQTFLKNYGQPGEVMVYATGLPGCEDYEIKLIYPSLGILSSIHGLGETLNKNGDIYTKVCLNTILDKGWVEGVTLWSPLEKISFDELLDGTSGVNQYMQINKVSNMSIRDFNNMLLGNNPTNCLEINMQFWEK